MKGALFFLVFFFNITAWASSQSFSVEGNQFSSEHDRSLGGSYTYGFSVIAATSDRALHWIYGADFRYGNVETYIDDVRRSAVFYGGDFQVGFKLSPVPGATIRPYLEPKINLGLRSLSFAKTPDDLPRDSTNFSYGYSVAIGAELQIFHSTALAVALSANSNTAVRLAAQDNFPLMSLGLSIGFGF